ncbi:unnamed protein product, partial [Discosporangium mesarthrocarpum]
CGWGDQPLLSPSQVSEVGEQLLGALLSLKHMGAMAAAQAGFQCVCEALLQHGDMHRGLCRLPSVWLDQLLQRLRGSNQEFVLRRSAGFAQAFLSLLKAEPRNVTPSLLPHGMHTLLELAQPHRTPFLTPPKGEAGEGLEAAGLPPREAGVGNWRARVHSLNILRLIFLDATLAEDVVLYVTKAMMASVCGFEDPSWAVRNSSMMLFTSLVQRAVGGETNVDMGGTQRAGGGIRSTRGAVTAQAFFRQHERLHPFLLQQLERATKFDDGQHDRRWFSGQGQKDVGDRWQGRRKMHPVLYPILLLLARLERGGADLDDPCPGTTGEVPATEEGLGAQGDPGQATSFISSPHSAAAAFIPLVKMCRSNPHYLARVASARALAALAPAEKIPSLVVELSQDLPKCPQQLRAAGAHNFVHGTLLQVLELLRAANRVCPSPVIFGLGASDGASCLGRSSSPIATLVSVGEEAILPCSWLVDPSKCLCPPIRSAMLLIIEELANLSRSVGQMPSDRFEPSDSNGELKAAGRGAVSSTGVSALQTARWLNLAKVLKATVSGLVNPVPGRSQLALVCVHRAVQEGVLRALCGEGAGGCTRDVKTGVSRWECGGVSAEKSPHLELDFALKLMSSPDSDVRDAAIKGLKRAFHPFKGLLGAGGERNCGGEGTLTIRDDNGTHSKVLKLVWAEVSRLIPSEKHPPNLRRLLRLLCRIGAALRGLGSSNLPRVGLPELWKHLSGLCLDQEARGGEVQGNALHVMGFLVYEKLPDLGEAHSKEWLKLLEEAADPKQAVSVRHSAAASIADSGVLHKGPGSELCIQRGGGMEEEEGGRAFATFLVGLWFVVLRLLQDDDERVRSFTACSCVSHLGTMTPSTQWLSAGGERG